MGSCVSYYERCEINASVVKADKDLYSTCQRVIAHFSFEKHSLSLISDIVRAKNLIEGAELAPLCRHERTELETIRTRIMEAISRDPMLLLLPATTTRV